MVHFPGTFFFRFCFELAVRSVLVPRVPSFGLCAEEIGQVLYNSFLHLI